jgi:hypothetical protein
MNRGHWYYVKWQVELNGSDMTLYGYIRAASTTDACQKFKGELEPRLRHMHPSFSEVKAWRHPRWLPRW